MQLILKNNNTLLLDDFEFKCSIGKKGRTKNKKEGDFKTPIGIYKIDTLFYRKDKYPNTITKLKKIPIQKDMGWCDDVNSKYYNKLIKLNKNVRHEKLFRKNSNYDLLIPISYNTKRPIKNKGSAIFIHLTKNYKKTLGCIAIKENDMLVLLKIVNKKTKIKII
jgi:L,D-peptidoglycan transpeptidase YkuD (ErfK/YbiS/YcfS/YnhG family)